MKWAMYPDRSIRWLSCSGPAARYIHVTSCRIASRQR